MTYFLDFDRTLFDLDEFKKYVYTRPELATKKELLEANFAKTLGDLLRSEELNFEPGELTPFLYSDSAQFLRDKENAATIITFGDPELQKKKVQAALVGIPRLSVMYVGELRKGTFLAPHTHLHKNAVLVDDSPLELEILAAEAPELQLYEMRRDGGVGDGRWPVIHSLSELP